MSILNRLVSLFVCLKASSKLKPALLSWLEHKACSSEITEKIYLFACYTLHFKSKLILQINSCV
jgi:hypothetical protein